MHSVSKHKAGGLVDSPLKPTFGENSHKVLKSFGVTFSWHRLLISGRSTDICNTKTGLSIRTGVWGLSQVLQVQAPTTLTEKQINDERQEKVYSQVYMYHFHHHSKNLNDSPVKTRVCSLSVLHWRNIKVRHHNASTLVCPHKEMKKNFWDN